MLRPARPNPEQFVPITIFPNAGGGFGFSSTTRGMGGTIPEGYDKTINCVVEGGLRLVALPKPEATLTLSSPPRPATNAISWALSDGTPIVFHLFGQGNGAVGVQSRGNVVDLESTPLASDPNPRIVLHDDGSGTAFLYASDNTTLRRRNIAGTWSSPSTNVPAIHLATVMGDLWRSVGTNEVSKCPLGSDPFVLSNWTTPVKVGSSDAKILRLDAIGPALIVFKEDGIWSFDEARTRFARVYALPRSSGHFPFTTPDGQGGLITATAFGVVLRLMRFGSVISVRPAGPLPGPYTPRGRIVDAVLYENKIYALMAGGDEWRTAGAGIQVLGWDGTQYVDITTTVTDADPSDSSVTITTSEGLLVGIDTPIAGIYVEASSGVAAGTLLLQRRDGVNTYTNLTTLNTAARKISATVINSLSFPGTIFTYDEAYNERARQTKVNGKYWYRIVSADSSATVSIREVRAVPWFPGAPSYPVIEGFAARNVWNSCISVNLGTWILSGSIIDNGDIAWDTLYAFPVAPATNIAVWDRQGKNDIPLLRVTTGSPTHNTRIYHIPILPDNKASARSFMAPIDDPEPPYGGMVPTFFPSATKLDGIYELRYVEVFGKHFWKDPSARDYLAIWAGMDDMEWSPPLTHVADEYVQFEFPPGLAGSELRLVLSMYLRTETRARPFLPQIDAITAWVKPVAPYVPRPRNMTSV